MKCDQVLNRQLPLLWHVALLLRVCKECLSERISSVSIFILLLSDIETSSVQL